MEQKMKIEIWSDIMCPFCYIGKHRMEKAFELFPNRNELEVVWKSFQLHPQIQYDSTKDAYDVVAEMKGVPKDQMKSSFTQIENMANDLGIKFDFNHVKMANTYDALRLVHLAEKYHLATEAKETLFKAFFEEGKNLSDSSTLLELGQSIGLPKQEIQDMLASEVYADEMNEDLYEATQIGVRGVPFFVFNRKYAVSGAQPVEAFVQTIEKSYAEWKKENPTVKLEIIEGQSCTPDGICE